MCLMVLIEGRLILCKTFGNKMPMRPRTGDFSGNLTYYPISLLKSRHVNLLMRVLKNKDSLKI